MFRKIHLLIMLLSVSICSQEAVLFKIPPPGLNLPAILTEGEEMPRSIGLGSIESKWTVSSSENADKLYSSFSSGTEGSMKQIIKDILVNASIPESKINKLNIKFTSGITEELGIDRDAIVFKDDFANKYKDDRLVMITKLFRVNDVKIEVTEDGAKELDPAVSSALSEGIRFGNKSESTVQNTMITELPHVIFGYERSVVSISRVTEQKTSIIIGVQTEVNVNSLNSIKALEGRPGDFFMKIGSKDLPKLLEFNITTENRSHSFRVSNREMYTISFFDKTDNSLTVTLSGFMVSFE
jgi:hypothetical protein